MPVFAFQHLIRLYCMRMGSHHHIHFLFQKDLCPLFLKGIHIPAVFRSPMGKHNHGIRLFPGLSDILPHLSFLFQKMYHIRIFLWQGNPVCAVRYIKQRQFHIVAHHDLVRTPRAPECRDTKRHGPQRVPL